MIESFDKLTIGKYKDIRALLDSGLSEVETNIELISILTDLDSDEIGDMPLSRFNSLMQGTQFLHSIPNRKMVASRYRLGKYDFETMLNLKDMTVAQYIDYQEYLKDADKNVTEIMSVFLIPKGKEYGKGYDILDVQRVIEDNMSIEEAISLAAFFLNLYQSLTKVTLISLIRQTKKMIRRSKDSQEKAKLEEVLMNLETAGSGLL